MSNGEMICGLCQKIFTSKRGFLVHFKKVHSLKRRDHQLKKAHVSCQEFECQFSCRTLKGLREHLSDNHGHSFTEMIKYFDSYSDFTSWLRNFEKHNDVEFYKDSHNLNAKSKVVYYKCNRSGFYKRKGKNKRIPKAQGSCKINGYCTAYIRAKEDSRTGFVTMNICNTHYGHVLDLKHLRVPKEDKKTIALKFEEGLTHDEILSEVKGTRSGNAQRTNLINKKDIHNVNLKLNCKPTHNITKITQKYNDSEMFSSEKVMEEIEIRHSSDSLKKDWNKLNEIKEVIQISAVNLIEKLQNINDINILKNMAEQIESLSLSLDDLVTDEQNRKMIHIKNSDSEKEIISCSNEVCSLLPDTRDPIISEGCLITSNEDHHSIEISALDSLETNYEDRTENPVVLHLSSDNCLSHGSDDKKFAFPNDFLDQSKSDQYQLQSNNSSFVNLLTDIPYEEENYRLNDTILHQILAPPFNDEF